jgi:hypothetical protein
MSDVEVARINVDDQAQLPCTYFHDTTPKIGIWRSGSKFLDEQHCFFVLICIEECDGLKHVLK